MLAPRRRASTMCGRSRSEVPATPAAMRLGRRVKRVEVEAKRRDAMVVVVAVVVVVGVFGCLWVMVCFPGGLVGTAALVWMGCGMLEDYATRMVENACVDIGVPRAGAGGLDVIVYTARPLGLGAERRVT